MSLCAFVSSKRVKMPDQTSVRGHVIVVPGRLSVVVDVARRADACRLDDVSSRRLRSDPIQ